MLMNPKNKKKVEQKKVGTRVRAAWFHLNKSIKMQDARKQTVVEDGRADCKEAQFKTR